MRSRALRFAFALTFAIASSTLAITTPARAGFEDTLGVGPEAMALGGSMIARSGSYAASYYNPAGLSPSGETGRIFELTLGAVYAHPSLHIDGANGKPLFPTSITGGASSVSDTGGFLFASRASIGHPLHLDGLNAGIVVFIPGQLFSWRDRPDDDMTWELLGDRSQVISIHAAIAYRVLKWLSIGVGARLLFNVQTNNTGVVTNVNLVNSNVVANTQIGTDAQVFASAHPIVGAQITPMENLHFGAVFRAASYVNDWGTTAIYNVPDLGTIGYNQHFAHYYEPLTLGFGGSWTAHKGFDVSFDIAYKRWSDALSNNINYWGPGRWGDTWEPSFGAKLSPTDALGVMAGYRFQKSPLDNFGGPSNMLDNDRHVVSLGLDVHLGKLLGEPSFNVHLKEALQYTILVERSEIKNPQFFPSDSLYFSNPGYPSYSYGGHMVAGQMSLEARW